MLGLIGKKLFPYPKDVYVQIPRICEDVHRQGGIKFADNIMVINQLTLKHRLSWIIQAVHIITGGL